MHYPLRKQGHRVLIWLDLVRDDGDFVVLSSDFAEARLHRNLATQQPCGRWAIPQNVAVDKCLIEGAT